MTYTLTPAPGTISIGAGGTSITGVGTAFTAYLKGYLINVPGFGIGQLADDPTSDTAATLVQEISASAITTAAFAAYPQPNAAVYSERVRELIETLGALAAIGIQPNAVGDYADRSGSDAQGKGYVFLSLDGNGSTITTPVLYIKNSTTAGDWTLTQITGPQGPAGLIGNWRGAWLTATAYALNDAVTENGNGYICLIAHTSGTFATDLTAGDWDLVVEKGDTGSAGADGADGANGIQSGIFHSTITADYTVVTGDNGKTLLCSSASTITLTMAQAAQFGFVVKNEGPGNVVLSPATGLIDGAASVTVPPFQSVFLLSGGSNYYTFFMAANVANWQLAQMPANTIKINNTGAAAQPIDGTPAQVRAMAGMVLYGYLFGLRISNDATTPNTVLDIATGEAASGDATPILMTLAAAMTKTTSAWAVGSGYGGLDTGTIASSTWYYIWLIERTDTGVVDVLLSLSATAPTMPASYTKKRRIGAILTDSSSHIVPFWQDGDDFLWATPILDVNVNNPGTSAVTRTLTAPPAIPTMINIAFLISSGTGTLYNGLVTSLNVADPTPTNTMLNNRAGSSASSGTVGLQVESTTGQVREHVDASDTNLITRIWTFGWSDKRGKQY